MKIIKNEFVSSCIMALMVAFLVWISLPRSMNSAKEAKHRPINVTIKSFIFAFAISYAVLYFLSDPSEDAIMMNILVGEPDF